MAIATGRPEAELIAAARNGDATAFAALYDQFADRVYRHVLYRIGSRTDSEDLTQQTFLKAWQAMPRYRTTEAPFVAWLLTIAHNTVVSYFRAKRDHVPLDMDMPLPARNGAEPHASAERTFNQAAVRLAISQLPPDQQQVVVMHYLNELDYADIARVLSKTENNVRVIAHRALKRLHRALEPIR